MAVVHGDPGPANIRLSADGPGLPDWDESRVDYTDLDFAELPGDQLSASETRDRPAGGDRVGSRQWPDR